QQQNYSCNCNKSSSSKIFHGYPTYIHHSKRYSHYKKGCRQVFPENKASHDCYPGYYGFECLRGWGIRFLMLSQKSGYPYYQCQLSHFRRLEGYSNTRNGKPP